MKPLFAVALTLASVLSYSPLAIGGSATWSTNPTSSDWNTPANWNPNTVPNGPSDVATFGVSTQSQVSVSANIEVNQIVFNSGASAYTITANAPNLFTVSGAGITNNSGIAQNFVSSGSNSLGNLFFTGNATAGAQTVFTNNTGAHLRFQDTSTSGDATFMNNDGGQTSFSDSSHAGNATFLNDGGQTNFFGESNAENATVEMNGSLMSFTGAASAGNGNFTLNSATVWFAPGSTASSATFTVNDGYISFFHSTTAPNATLIINNGSMNTQSPLGGTSRLVLNDSVLSLSLSNSRASQVTLGSIEGSGQIYLSNDGLVVGANNLSTVFSGTISATNQTGSIDKVGSGTFTLTGANQYGGRQGGTSVGGGGALLINNTDGSGTGKGPVEITDGTLGGSGIIAGAVEVGANQSAGVLAPSDGGTTPVTLTIQKTLTFDSLSTYTVALDSHARTIDAVVANGVSINGAQFSMTDLSNRHLRIGSVFTVIQNTSRNAIVGTFANLPDGGTITVGSNTFQANYEGGDGHDLTLTVVP